MIERWKVIPKYPLYEVSTMGRVRNIQTGRILKNYDDGKGYLRVKLNGGNCRVHILVAEAFIPNPDNKPIVNHKRGKKNDPRASQLEWVTQSENIKHAWDKGLRRRGGGKRCEKANGKLTPKKLLMVGITFSPKKSTKKG